MGLGPYLIAVVFLVVTANQFFELLLGQFELGSVGRLRGRLGSP